MQSTHTHTHTQNTDIHRQQIRGRRADTEGGDASFLITLIKQSLIFLDLVQSHYANMTLSLGWTTELGDDLYTMAMMEEMWAIVQNLSQICGFLAPAALLKVRLVQRVCK